MSFIPRSFRNPPQQQHAPAHPTNTESNFPETHPETLASEAGSRTGDDYRPRFDLISKPDASSRNGDSGFTERERSDSNDSTLSELHR